MTVFQPTCFLKLTFIFTKRISFPKIFYTNLHLHTRKMINSIDDILELRAEHVYIKNKDEVLNKINAIIQAGLTNLQIVSDYDMTLTKQHVDGKKHLSSFGLFSMCPSIPPYFAQKEKELSGKYRPIEFDPFISFEEKFKAMEEWWLLSVELLRGIKVPAEEIDQVVVENRQQLRDGTFKLFNDLNKNQVPVLVFSAGLGDTVEAVLRSNQIVHPNVKIISNYLDFDENRVIRGYKNEVIHVLNKNEQVIKGTEYYEMIKNRCNVILMGDHLGDAGMAEGVCHNVVLKIGFLYERIDECLQDYLNTFDIVLVDDQTMDVVRGILKPLLK